jgi:hypothetical protein
MKILKTYVPKTTTNGFVYLLKLATNGTMAKQWKKNQKKVKKQATE